MRPSLFALCLSFALPSVLAACGGDETRAPIASGGGAGGGGAGGGQGGAATGPLLGPFLDGDCDPLVPTQCGFPFPSNVWLVGDLATPTGARVAFGPATLPRSTGGVPIDPSRWADSDGFSPSQAPMTHLPGATLAGLPALTDLDLSLAVDSPSVLLDAETGERVPHFVELDRVASPEPEAERTLMIRPLVRLADGRRYVVALRRVVDAAGAPVAPSPAFAALRDGAPSADPSVERRRGLYADIFGRLERAGVARDDLQIAWDYTTASRQHNTGPLVHMRDLALAAVGEQGPEYTIVDVELAPNEHVRKRITARMRVPLFLKAPGPGAGGGFFLGPDGLPAQNGWAEYDVLIHVPNSATGDAPAALVQNGHGLLGSKAEGRDGYLVQIANEMNYVAFSVDFVGMSSEDQPEVVAALTGDIGRFRASVERQHQGVINSLLAMRMMKGRFAADPELRDAAGRPVVDPTQSFYRGDSQGGIFGGTYMAVSTDVTRGLLSVPGMPYNLLLNRSTNFTTFFALLDAVYGTTRDVQLALALVQMHWDRTDPSGYMPYVGESPLPGTPAHRVLLHVGIGDPQVTPLGAHVMARAAGAKNLAPVNRPVWGVDEATAPLAAGSAMVEFDFGAPPLPLVNTPPADPALHGAVHEGVRRLPSAYRQADRFFRTGVIESFCDGPCDPELARAPRAVAGPRRRRARGPPRARGPSSAQTSSRATAHGRLARAGRRLRPRRARRRRPGRPRPARRAGRCRRRRCRPSPPCGR